MVTKILEGGWKLQHEEQTDDYRRLPCLHSREAIESRHKLFIMPQQYRGCRILEAVRWSLNIGAQSQVVVPNCTFIDVFLSRKQAIDGLR